MSFQGVESPLTWGFGRSRTALDVDPCGTDVHNVAVVNQWG